MCYIGFFPWVEVEGGAPTTARCMALHYDTENLDGRERPRIGRVLARWDADQGSTYRRWVMDTVDEQRQRLLLEGTITETYKERFGRLARAL